MGRNQDKEKETAIYNFITEGINKNGVAPSVREIAAKFECMPSNVQRYLVRMEKSGKITRTGTRQIVTKYNNSPLIQIPLVGTVSCGSPLLAEQNIDMYIPMKRELVGDGEFFALTAKGDSMIDAGIDPKDIVIVRRQNYAAEGDIVVALIDNEATLKRYFIDKKNKRIVLHPENKTMSDMYFDEITIQGVATKIIKDIK